MGKGKNINSSKSAYRDCHNYQIKNNRFLTTQHKLYLSGADTSHSIAYICKYLLNSSNHVKMTRRPRSMSSERKKGEFYKLISNYEMMYGKKLCDTSKNELLMHVQNCAEQNNSLLTLADDAEQFMANRIVLFDIVKIYLYKTFYPRIFDVQVSDCEIRFDSSYISEYFDDIFCSMEQLFETIIFDGIVMAVSQNCISQIESIQGYKGSTYHFSNIKDYVEYFNLEFGTHEDFRIKLLKIMIPDIVFSTLFAKNMYKSRIPGETYFSSLFKKKLFYQGKRSIDCKNALKNTYVQCHELFDTNILPFSRLLNIYDINNRSGLFDLYILKNNIDFKPYYLDGIVTKFHINSMIIDNGKHLSPCSAPDLTLSSVRNNPNCIIKNISERDYEMIHDIMTTAQISISKYYLTNITIGHNIEPSRLLEIIDFLNERDISKRMSDIVPVTHLVDIDTKIDKENYERILRFHNSKIE